MMEYPLHLPKNRCLHCEHGLTPRKWPERLSLKKRAQNFKFRDSICKFWDSLGKDIDAIPVDVYVTVLSNNTLFHLLPEYHHNKKEMWVFITAFDKITKVRKFWKNWHGQNRTRSSDLHSSKSKTQLCVWLGLPVLCPRTMFALSSRLSRSQSWDWGDVIL